MKHDFDADEKQFLTEIGENLDQLRDTAGRCPHPDAVMAAFSGVETDDRENVLQHLSVCPVCQRLTRDLSEYEYPSASEDEDRRIRARWEHQQPPVMQARLKSTLMPYGIAAAAVVLLAVALLVVIRQGAEQNPDGNVAENKPPSIAPPAEPVKSRTTFVLSKAAIKVPTSAVLIFRSGKQDGSTFLKELAEALEPYRTDDFGGAAQRLGALAPKYRESAEVPFYLAVSQLFLGENGSALESLLSARRSADETLKDDVSWYLAIAFDRVGRIDEAQEELSDLCAGSGNYQKQACASLEELK